VGTFLGLIHHEVPAAPDAVDGRNGRDVVVRLAQVVVDRARPGVEARVIEGFGQIHGGHSLFSVSQDPETCRLINLGPLHHRFHSDNRLHSGLSQKPFVPLGRITWLRTWHPLDFVRSER